MSDADLLPLAPEARKVHWIASFIGSATFAGIITAVDVFWKDKFGWWPFEAGRVAMVVAPLLMLHAAIYPPFWFRSWRYALRENDVLLCYGVVWRTRRSIPRGRIQHVDIESGPIDRMVGLADLTLYTAGGDDEENELPGLRLEDAEAIREELLARNPAEEWERSGRGPHG